MKNKISNVINLLKSKGVDYADIRIVEKMKEEIITENSKVQDISNSTSKGVGIRVITDGRLGFSCTQDLEKLEEIALEALEVAKSSKMLQGEKIEMQENSMLVDNYLTPIEIDPFNVSKEDKLSLLFEVEKIMNDESNLYKTSTFMEFQKETKIYADTNGRFITQTFYESGAGISAVAVSDNDTQTRSYPNSLRGNYASVGYEYILTLNLVKNAREIASEAVQLLHAKECPAGHLDVIIDGSQLAVQIHESIGHAVELDRVLGWEADYSGGSFLQIENTYENYKYASEYITIFADATTPQGLGTFGYDDDGIKAQKTCIIDKGILKSFLTSSDTAAKVNQKSNGASRADGWKNTPIIRMTNINLEPGCFELDELIKDVNYGLYLSTNKSWSIDDKRLNFQFACEIAYEIKNGKFTGEIFKNPVYSGITPEFWKSCDGVCNKNYWKLYSITNCGKGYPIQNAHISHGVSPARFRCVKVGV